MSQFTWIGAMTKDTGLCISWAQSPFRTIDDARKQQMVVAGTGAGSDTDTFPVVLNDLIGTKFKVVTGYLGTQETMLAVERGEAHGRCVISYSALRLAKPDWLSEKKINVLLQVALERNKDFPDVPLVFDLLPREEDRQLIALQVGPLAMARSFTGPPGMPAAKATLLRRAFDDTMKDPAFVAESDTLRADLDPSTGETVQQLVAKIYATPRPVIERVKKYFAP